MIIDLLKILYFFLNLIFRRSNAIRFPVGKLGNNNIRSGLILEVELFVRPK